MMITYLKVADLEIHIRTSSRPGIEFKFIEDLLIVVAFLSNVIHAADKNC